MKKSLRNLGFMSVGVLSLSFMAGVVYAQTAVTLPATTITTGTTGIVATVLAVLGFALPLFNIIMSGISQGFAVLHKGEPGWLQTLGTYGLQASKVLTANTNLPATPVVTPSN
jgi:hypothetical protein